MMNLGLTGAELRDYRAALTDTGTARIRVTSRVLGGEVDGQLSDFLDDGQVTVDNTQDVTRAATLTLHDPRRQLPFNTDSPSRIALFMDRMIRVSHSIPFGDDRQSCPLFTGPITKLDRDGDLVTVECQGKEILFLSACWNTMTLHKGMKKTDAIRRLLTEGNPVYSEQHLDIPDLPAELPKPLSLHRDAKPWVEARKIARSMDMQLFYDGAGVCRLRRRPKHASVSFTGARYVVTDPQVAYSDEWVNAVVVRGPHPTGPKRQVVAFAVAPASHPLSPQRTGRYRLPGDATIQSNHAKTHAEAKALADRKLADGLRQGVDVSFDSVPVPFLDPGDLCHVGTSDGSVTFRLGMFAFSLSGQPMTVGYHRELKRKHHRRPHAKRRNRK